MTHSCLLALDTTLSQQTWPQKDGVHSLPSELHLPTAHWQSDCPLGACSQVCPRPYVICMRQCASVNISVTTSCGGQVFPFAPSKKKAVVILEVPPSSSDSNATIWYDGSVTIVANNELDWLGRLTVWLYSTHLKWWKESQTGWSIICVMSGHQLQQRRTTMWISPYLTWKNCSTLCSQGATC